MGVGTSGWREGTALVLGKHCRGEAQGATAVEAESRGSSGSSAGGLEAVMKFSRARTVWTVSKDLANNVARWEGLLWARKYVKTGLEVAQVCVAVMTIFAFYLHFASGVHV